MISDQEPGATNIHPADVNGDGKMDFIASRGHGRGVIWFEGPDWIWHDIDAEIKEPHAWSRLTWMTMATWMLPRARTATKWPPGTRTMAKDHFEKHVVGDESRVVRHPRDRHG